MDPALAGRHTTGGDKDDPEKLGTNGPASFHDRPGCMGMSDFYGPADRGESIATIHAALDAGITLLDTGDSTAWATTKC